MIPTYYLNNSQQHYVTFLFYSPHFINFYLYVLLNQTDNAHIYFQLMTPPYISLNSSVKYMKDLTLIFLVLGKCHLLFDGTWDSLGRPWEDHSI